MTMKKKKLPIGIENFEELQKEEFYYVDKTNLIRDLLMQWSKVNLFTRPRRFGKSFTANMLAAYYSRGCESGAMFSGLNIGKTEEFKDHLNKYDVIHMDISVVSVEL